ncbi:cellulose synthase operon protein YhjQ/BcsQ [Granulicella sp. dw_53]|uniref:cellulose synthase operon protein YhjQ/BcsQ n=1 Tax=Granulicella sp. dw_53 TaxID=2719792 RepID=UPI001BD40200|nr:cellulose synthase operon protein YhjQ/BcsQ [Granulicella sp. dw_53]
MDSRGLDRIDETQVADTPEDVAVLYSWANLHGAKYRDFSASRREYRAQLRHRAAEQVREQELQAQAEAEAAASSADAAAQAAVKQAEATETSEGVSAADSNREQALREADRASRIAAAERVEAARRAEAAAVAEAAARTEEREIAEAQASARRQEAQYAESEIRSRRSRSSAIFEVPGETSDPYTPNSPAEIQAERTHERLISLRNHSGSTSNFIVPRGVIGAEAAASDMPIQYQDRRGVPVSETERVSEGSIESFAQYSARTSGQRRPQGYRPDDASGVRQIYRAPESEEPKGEYVGAEPVRHLTPARVSYKAYDDDAFVSPAVTNPVRGVSEQAGRGIAARSVVPQEQAAWPFSSDDSAPADFGTGAPQRREGTGVGGRIGQEPTRGISPSLPIFGARTVSSPPTGGDPARGRRAQDDMAYKATPVEASRQSGPPSTKGKVNATPRVPYVADPSGPAWLYAPQTPVVAVTPQPVVSSPIASTPSIPVQSSVADTLQHSRERVAARWFALKGVFEQPGQDQLEAPIRQKETRTPVLAVFSLAGGVGKTSLVATLGRALSSLGEKVLLTDTTSHGLLPFYFGASELRQGVVRTFSPPSGSTDAPIYLVSYDVDQRSADDAVQEQLVEEIIANSKGTHRILLDLTPASGWVARRMAGMSPTVLVPLAPDMNSVISLQAVEKYFHGVVDSDGRPLQPYFLINQFDASLPLHLDVREVLRRQLGDRLLPFVIRRAPAVSEALAEGMTVMDYAPETPIAEDYQNVAAWLRTIAAPATAGFRNVRWSER